MVGHPSPWPFAGPEVGGSVGVKVCLHVPMLIQQRVVGILSVNSLIPCIYTDDDVCFLTLMANPVGIALDRAWKHQALQEREEQFRLLAEHAQDIIYRYRLVPMPGFEYVSPVATAILKTRGPA